ncbi:MAG: PCRF domain-containing protein, partial [Candidatus Marinimicrobia bacterium]|nr:PCRF domain-containing protein [Candidatus Neomarinimicrobiota bacterium]
MLEKLKEIIQRHQELAERMSDPAVAADPQQYAILAKEHSELDEVAGKARVYIDTVERLKEAEELIAGGDLELKELAQEEAPALRDRLQVLEEQLKILILPKDPHDDKNTILEIRGGTGGQEAALFAGDLYRMYTRYAALKGWDVEVLDTSHSDLGGVKEIIFEVRGRGAFSRLKYERGVHRVQRVPVTEAMGRIHTSTATVAVLPEVDEVEVDIRPDDLRIDIFHAGGPGGQNVNKVATAVRIVHVPTGTVAVC